MGAVVRCADWIVQSVRSSDYMRGVQIEIVNLNWPEGHPYRRASWTIPADSIDDPRYDWTGASFLDEESKRRVCEKVRLERLNPAPVGIV